MKKSLLLISAVVLSTAASAQVVKDTIITGAGYLNQKYYSLSADEKATAGAKVWHLGFATEFQNSDVAIRFNSLTGDLRLLPNASLETAITSVDTSGWAAQGRLVDMDSNYYKGAFNQSGQGGQMDYSWGTYNQVTHGVSGTRVFGAKIGTDFYAMYFNMSTATNKYTVTYFKLGATDSVSYEVSLAAYTSKNFVYSNLVDMSTLDLEPAKADWDLFFGQYVTNVGGGQHYPVAGVLNNLGTEVAKVITTDPVNYTKNGSEVYSSNNNVINYTWKASGPNGVTIADTVVYFIKATDGAIWKVRFTGFVSGAGAGADAGSYILEKEVVSAVGVEKVTSSFTEMYPNPANNTLQVVIDAKGATTVSIYAMTGAIVSSMELNEGLQTATVNTADLTNGIYQVVVTSNGWSTTKKLVVQH